MAYRKATALYFTTVCAYPGDMAALGGHLQSEDSDPIGTRFMLINQGAWGFLFDIREVIYAMVLRTPTGEKRRLCILGRDGLYREYPSGGSPIDIPIKPTEAGYLEDLAVVGDEVYACGAQGQVYRLNGGTWKAIDRGLRIPFDGDDVKRLLLSISGFSTNDVYTCGFEGEIWHWDGKKWRELDSPTNFPLNCVLCASDGRTYFCGANGTLLALEADGTWTDLARGKLGKISMWDMAQFKGLIHVAAGSSVLAINGAAVQKLPTPSEGKLDAMALAASDDKLWCVGGDDVFSFDGKAWTRHVCPEN
ncbi:hypothetical protein [Roseateles violae]|uniref:Uncharacterized protein n=1 Tax=Roseateles violae TaxID=3058042 RepID=A0ABT8DPC9_9BURK|nr:hypothetical protein [Pelomonas sp. PFR6]MDN3920017.1 hypothetical protein [Pelomonas sp. PFR6]